jgi:hypothetical protein
MITVILTKKRFELQVVPGEKIADLRKRISEDLKDETQDRPFTMKVKGERGDVTCSDSQLVDTFFPSRTTAVHIQLTGKKPPAPASSGPLVCQSSHRVRDH